MTAGGPSSGGSAPGAALLPPDSIPLKHVQGVPDLGYLELPENFQSQGGSGKPSWMRQEGFRDKFIRKTGENPFVPIGLGLTVAALSYGLWTMKTGDRVMSQRMMRVRVAAQSFTVIALLSGVFYQSMKHKSNDHKDA